MPPAAITIAGRLGLAKSIDAIAMIFPFVDRKQVVEDQWLVVVSQHVLRFIAPVLPQVFVNFGCSDLQGVNRRSRPLH